MNNSFIEIDIKGSGLDQAGAFLEGFGQQAVRGIRAALMRAGRGVSTDAKIEAAKIYVIKRADVARAFSVGRPVVQSGRVEIAVGASGSPVPLSRFRTRPSRPGARRPAVGASVMVKKSEGFKLLPGTFLARMKAGHIGIYERKGIARLPIVEKFGPSVPGMIEDDAIQRKIYAGAYERFQKRMTHEINRRLMT